MTSQRPRSRQPSDPWADWALDADASSVQPVEFGLALAEPLPAARPSADVTDNQWAPSFDPDDEPSPPVSFPVVSQGSQQLASTNSAANPMPPPSSAATSARPTPTPSSPTASNSAHSPNPSHSSNPSNSLNPSNVPTRPVTAASTPAPAALVPPARPVPPVPKPAELIEDFTGEFDAIEAGEWDDEPFRYLDDPTGTISKTPPTAAAESGISQTASQTAPKAPEPIQTLAKASPIVGQPTATPTASPTPTTMATSKTSSQADVAEHRPKPNAGSTQSAKPAGRQRGAAAAVGEPAKASHGVKAANAEAASTAPVVLPKKRRRRKLLRRSGIALLTVVALTTAYVTWQFATLRRNEANSRTLDLPGVAPGAPFPVIPTLPGQPTTVAGNNLDPDATEFDESLPGDAVTVAPGPTTPVITVPGQGSCDDDPACANAPVVVLPEAEKPREGGLLVDRVSVDPIGGVDAQNILLIGSDSRADLPDNQKTGFGSVGGNRSDTIIVMRISPDGKTAALLSFPRDTYVHLAGSGKNDRINSAYAKGVNSLVRTIQENFNIPINHVAEVDFAGFQKIVGTLGGIEICFDYPARDKVTKLNVQAGCQVLNQTQATAYVRSRHYEQLVNGQWKSDGRGDIGRVQRQQRFIKQVLEKVIGAGGRNPITAQGLIGDLKSAVTLDKTYGISELYGTAKTFGAFEPDALQGFTLPTSAARIDGKAVLRVKRAEASQLVARFGVRQ